MRPDLKLLDWTKYPKGDYIRARTLESIPFWIAAAISACVATAYAYMFTAIEHLTVAIYNNHFSVLFFLTPICFLLSWYSVRRFAPGAIGSGIPQLIASLEMDPDKDLTLLDRLLGFKMLCIKWVSSMIALLGGGIIGCEGPTVQISGSVFYLVRKWLPIEVKASHGSMMVAGAAAGLAAAFNTPLGGIVYAVEELTKVHLSNFRTAVLQAVLVAGLLVQWLAGPYLYLGFPALQQVPSSFLGISLLVGAVTGAAGAIYSLCLLKAGRWASQLDSWRGALLTVILGLSFVCLTYVCGEHVLGSGKHVLLDLLFRANTVAHFREVAGRFIGGILSYAIGGSCGTFSPSLAMGAVMGSVFEPLMPYPAPHLLTLLGMVGFLTGVTQTPFTSFVLVLEMTDRHSSIFFLMIAAMVGHGVAKMISPEPFYEAAAKAWHKGPELAVVPGPPPS